MKGSLSPSSRSEGLAAGSSGGELPDAFWGLGPGEPEGKEGRAGICPERLSPASLAYLGDAVYELYARSHYLLPPKRLGEYHRQVVSCVRAESQAACLQSLEPHLTEAEREIVRRGRNGARGRPRRLSPQTYQQATSLETLIGYLYLKNPQRLHQLLEIYFIGEGAREICPG